MTNDKCELYEFSLHTIRELHTNQELRITNCEYAHSVAAPYQISFKITKNSDNDDLNIDRNLRVVRPLSANTENCHSI